MNFEEVDYEMALSVLNNLEISGNTPHNLIGIVFAKEAVKKQIPKKPIGRHTNYKCPICDRRVRSGKGSSSFGVDHFCQRCGQALDWSDT